VDLVKAHVDELLDVRGVLVKVGGDEDPVREVLGPDQLRHIGDVLRVADVLLGEGHPAVRPLADGVRLGDGLCLCPRDVDLEQLRHGVRIPAALEGALGELVPEHVDLLVGRRRR